MKTTIEKPNSHVYVYKIDSNNALMYDRSMPRGRSGGAAAKARVKELEDQDAEAFYTIGTLTKIPALY